MAKRAPAVVAVVRGGEPSAEPRRYPSAAEHASAAHQHARLAAFHSRQAETKARDEHLERGAPGKRR